MRERESSTSARRWGERFTLRATEFVEDVPPAREVLAESRTKVGGAASVATLVAAGIEVAQKPSCRTRRQPSCRSCGDVSAVVAEERQDLRPKPDRIQCKDGVVPDELLLGGQGPWWPRMLDRRRNGVDRHVQGADPQAGGGTLLRAARIKGAQPRSGRASMGFHPSKRIGETTYRGKDPIHICGEAILSASSSR